MTLLGRTAVAIVVALAMYTLIYWTSLWVGISVTAGLVVFCGSY